MPLTLLKRIGKYGILGNDQGNTFLVEAADDDYWGYFERPVMRVVPPYLKPRIRQLEVMTVGAALYTSLPAAVEATWREIAVPVHDHGPIKVAAYFDRATRHGYPTADYPGAHKSRWLVFEEKQ